MIDRPNALRQCAKRILSAVVPRKLFLTSGPPTSGAVCLTFDDGPHPQHTPEVLEALARHRVRATFFVVGEAAARNPALVRNIVDAGHEVGNHSYTHPDPETITARALTEEARRTDELLTELTGCAPAAFRPPRGKIAAATLLERWLQRQTVALWNADPRDYEAPSQRALLDRLAAHRLSPGDIVLMHDTHPWCATAIEHVVAQARAHGLNFITVSQMSQ